MNIKDIAELSGVSISTVSKIMNGKDNHINIATRERVLKLVKEYNYTPYSSVKNAAKSKSFLLGALLNGNSENNSLIHGMLDYGRENGYGVIISSSYSNEDELKNITMLCKNNVDGVIWDRMNESSSEHIAQFNEFHIPVYTIDSYLSDKIHNICIDYEQLGYNATKSLIDKKHVKIGCLVKGQGIQSEKFIKGYKRCLFENKIPFELCMISNEKELDFGIYHITGIVCDHVDNAISTYNWSISRNYKIPQDLSIIGLTYEESIIRMCPKLSLIHIPCYHLGQEVCKRVIHKIEKNKEKIIDFNSDVMVDDLTSIDVPATYKNKKIVVVGSIHMDVIVNVDELPQIGKTVRALNHVMVPGGKGVNQAIGVAKLGTEVSLIANIGKDYEGTIICDTLNNNNVNVQGVKTDDKLPTGKAYIHVQRDGESSIVIYAGANDNLVPENIIENTSLFENASFCLLQTEIPTKTVENAAKIAKKNNVKIILKPSASKVMSDKLIKMIDIFVPNEKEINILCPDKITLEEKAQYFLDKGVGTIIITLGHEGCYLKDSQHSMYFPAADFEAIDTTGAADAFIATLAVYLSDNHDIVDAIKHASYAAGYSVTRQGVLPALIDKNILEMHFSMIK